MYVCTVCRLYGEYNTFLKDQTAFSKSVIIFSPLFDPPVTIKNQERKSMSFSPIKSDIETIVHRNIKQQRKRDVEARNAPKTPPGCERKQIPFCKTKIAEQPREEPEKGLRQTQRMVAPQPKPNMLNEEMAIAAAKKYKKNKKNIRKACKKLEPEEQAREAKACCIIM